MTDWNEIDMPATLGRMVSAQDQVDPTKWVRDDAWYADIRTIYRTLAKFLADNQLVAAPFADEPIDLLVLRFSELTSVGQQLSKSGAIDRWLGSFDRSNRRKALTGIRSLERALAELSRTH